MAFQISLETIDAYGRVSTKRFGNDRTLVADALTDAGTLVTKFLAVSDAGTVKHSITLETAAANAATAGANIDAGCTIHCTLADGTGYALKIPAPDPDILGADGSVDLTDGAVIDYVALFESGGHFTVSDGEVIASMRYGELDR